MAQYNGSIRINTNINTKGAKKSLSSLAQAIIGIAERLSSLKAKMETLEKQKTPTEEYKALQDYISQTESSIGNLTESLRRLEGEGLQDSDVYRDISSTIEEMNTELECSRARMQELVDIGRAFEVGSNSEEHRHLQEEIENVEKALKKLVAQYQALNAIEKTREDFQKAGEAAKNMFSKISGSAEEAKESNSSMAGRIKGLALSFLIFKELGEEVDSFVETIEESFENFHGENDRFKNSINGLKASVLTLKNAFEAAFVPLVQMAIPYIQNWIDVTTSAMGAIGQFIAAITGQKTYTKSIKQTTAAIKDQTKAQNRQLSSLDKLNNLTSDKGSGSDAGSSGGMFEEVPVDNKFIEMANKIKEILSQIFRPLKTAWENQGKFVMDSWKYALEENWNLAKSVGWDFLTVWNQPETISMLENILIIVGDIGLVVGNLANKFREAWETNDIGLHILENIRDIFAIIIAHIKNAADFTVEWSEKLDFYPLLESVNGLLEALKPLTDNIGAGLEWFWNNVLLPIAGWTIEDAIPAFLDMLSAAITVVNNIIEALKPLGQWFWDEFLQPLGQWEGEVIISAMETVTDLLTKFGDWISEHKDIVLELATDFVIFSYSCKAVALAMSLFNGAGTITASIIGKINDAIALLTSPIVGVASLISGIVIAVKNFITMLQEGFSWLNEIFMLVGIALAAIGAIILGVPAAIAGIVAAIVAAVATIVVVIHDNWDAICEWFSGVADWINENVIQPVIEFFKGVWDSVSGFFLSLWEDIKSVWGIVSEWFNDTLINPVKEAFESACDAIGGFFEGLWNGIKTGVVSAMNTVIGGIESAINWIVDGINKIISGFNSVASWAAGIIGVSWGGVDLVPNVSLGRIPMLATGTVIPPNREFLAVLGDQKHGTNIEAPLSTIEEAVENVLNRKGGAGGVKELTIHVPVEVDGNVLFELIRKLDLQQFNQTGEPSFQI